MRVSKSNNKQEIADKWRPNGAMGQPAGRVSDGFCWGFKVGSSLRLLALIYLYAPKRVGLSTILKDRNCRWGLLARIRFSGTGIPTRNYSDISLGTKNTLFKLHTEMNYKPSF